MLLAACLAASIRVSAEPPDVDVVGRAFTSYSSSFTTLALSPDGKTAAASDGRSVALWGIDGALIRVIPTGGELAREALAPLAFSPDGERLLAGGGGGELGVWDAASGSPAGLIKARALIAAYSPDGGRVLTGDRAGLVSLWSSAGGELLRTLKGHAAPVVAAAWAADGRRAMTVSLDNAVILWDLERGAALKTFREPGHFVRGSFISPDQKGFLFGGRGLSLRSLDSGGELKAFPQRMPSDNALSAVAFSPDGERLIAEAEGLRLNLWEVKTGRLLRSFSAPRHMLSAAFTPDGKTIVAVFASLSKAATIVAWPADAQGEPRAAAARALPTPDPGKAALGRLLFFDPRLSGDGLVSCASCHDPKKGWTDRRPVSIKGRRNTLTILNAALHRPLFWDGRAASLEDQVRFPLSHPGEMGGSPDQAARSVAAVPGYRPFFKAAFGDEAATPGRIAEAVAEFERTLISMDSPYDRHALPPRAQRGLDLFRGKGRCFICHELSPSKDPEFINLGFVGRGDPGRYEVTKDEKDRGAFIVPDLRNLKYTAPYMHDGSLATLAEVVDFYDRGGGSGGKKFTWLSPLGLTEKEKADLVSFLEALSGDPLEQEPPRLPR